MLSLKRGNRNLKVSKQKKQRGLTSLLFLTDEKEPIFL